MAGRGRVGSGAGEALLLLGEDEVFQDALQLVPSYRHFVRVEL